MKICTKGVFIWNGKDYVMSLKDSTWYNYEGPIDKCCGSTSQQNQSYQTQTAITATLQQQLSTVFGNASNVFNDLNQLYTPIANAGPSQEGFSAGEKAALDTQAIDATGSAYESAKKAIAEQTAAFGGGNSYMPSGAEIGPQLALSEKAAQQQAGELNTINLEDYATGRQNWLTAASGLAGAPSVFNPSTALTNPTVNSGEATSNTANQIAQQNNSWVNAVTGLAGSLGGAAIGNFSGGGSTPSAYDPNLSYQPTDIAPTGSGGVFGTPPI